MVTWETYEELQTKLFIDSPLPFVGTLTILSVAVVQATTPIPGASVTLKVGHESDLNSITTLTALDNGQPPDGVAGDGLYAVAYTPLASGRYSVMASISGNTLQGVAFTRRHASGFTAMSSGGKFSTSRPFVASVTRNPPVLTGELAAIHLDVPIDVTIAGDFLVIGKLRTPGTGGQPGTPIDVRKGFALATGEQTVRLTVPASDLPTPYQNGYYVWGDLVLLGPTSHSDWKLDERPLLPASVLLNETDWPVKPWSVSSVEWLPDDSDDPDTKFDRLLVRVNVNVQYGGTYVLSADLTGCCYVNCTPGNRSSIDWSSARSAVGGGGGTFTLVYEACRISLPHQYANGIGPSGLASPLALQRVNLTWADPDNPKPYQGEAATFKEIYYAPNSIRVDQFECYDASSDSNQNGIPDACDILDGTSRDRNANGIPDEAEPPPPTPCPPWQPGACPADVTGVGGPPSCPDGQLTVDDLIAFINAFGAGDLFADITGIGGPPGGPDGQVTIDDLIAFINSFGDGCGGGAESR